MGIYCEINLNRCCEDGHPPGSTVSGLVKYAVDEETVFNTITISLKGLSEVMIIDKHRRRQERARPKYYNRQTVLDIDSVVTKDEKGLTLSVGSYEVPFSFILPEKIPPSVHLTRYDDVRYRIHASILYYVRIKFERPGMFKQNKHYRKIINVLPTITEKLPMEPVVYGEQKSLLQLFSSKKSIVNIKATISHSVVRPGETVHINYEINNDTKVIIKGVTVKLIEEFKFPTTAFGEVEIHRDIEESKSGSIPSGEEKTFEEEVSVPADAWSVDHSDMMSKDYLISITVNLPFPHIDLVLCMPVQVGVKTATIPEIDGPPPSYWEAMGEEDDDKNIDNEADSGDECETVEKKK